MYETQQVKEKKASERERKTEKEKERERERKERYFPNSYKPLPLACKTCFTRVVKLGMSVYTKAVFMW